MGNNSGAQYAAELLVGFSRNLFDESGNWRPAGWLLLLGVALGWCLCPFAVQTVFHPTDLLRAQAALAGLPKLHAYSAGQVGSGLLQAIFALAVLLVFQLVGTVLFYRRARLFNVGAVAAPALWPVAALLTGILGNACWLVGTGEFDVIGCLVGFSSLALTGFAEWIVEGLGRDFVFGPAAGDHPPIPQNW